ncbi:hypothetical protein GQA70_20795 (plasmid) [Ponticoccus alexandrii]|uniref:Transposase n=1 Tax=Ponticoccus alexandrii TaxID=1943633 RepID=A0ABX7FF10_9RHOB|nr:hypothetical protein GQA70_20795 [Ponticoccus alexandrii]
MIFPKEHRAKLHSTNPSERLNGEPKRRRPVVGIFRTSAPSTASSARCVSDGTVGAPEIFCKAPRALAGLRACRMLRGVSLILETGPAGV